MNRARLLVLVVLTSHLALGPYRGGEDYRDCADVEEEVIRHAWSILRYYHSGG